MQNLIALLFLILLAVSPTPVNADEAEDDAPNVVPLISPESESTSLFSRQNNHVSVIPPETQEEDDNKNYYKPGETYHQPSQLEDHPARQTAVPEADLKEDVNDNN